MNVFRPNGPVSNFVVFTGAFQLLVLVTDSQAVDTLGLILAITGLSLAPFVVAYTLKEIIKW